MPSFTRAATVALSLLSSMAAALPFSVDRNACHTGLIQVRQGSTKLGYLSSGGNPKGLYFLTGAEDGALHVKICQPTDALFTPFGITDVAGFRHVGLIQGVNNDPTALPITDIGDKSPNYLFLGDVTETPIMSVAKTAWNSYTQTTGVNLGVESEIWKFDNLFGSELKPTWINSDMSEAPATILLHNGANTFLLTGDADASLNYFSANAGEYTPVSFRFDIHDW